MQHFPQLLLQMLSGADVPRPRAAPPLLELCTLSSKVRQPLVKSHNASQQAAIAAALTQHSGGFTLIQVISLGSQSAHPVCQSQELFARPSSVRQPIVKNHTASQQAAISAALTQRSAGFTLLQCQSSSCQLPMHGVLWVPLTKGLQCAFVGGSPLVARRYWLRLSMYYAGAARNSKTSITVALGLRSSVCGQARARRCPRRCPRDPRALPSG